MSIKLISTDFDGTLFAEFENPPVPLKLQKLIGDLQAQGAKWVINTGRDLSSLMETIGRSHLQIKPDYLVVVEREIYFHRDNQYLEDEPWNLSCTNAHIELFKRVRGDLPQLISWVHDRFTATIYEDSYSPFCLIAEKNEDADIIYAYLQDYCRKIPHLTIVRSDIYARFSHESFNKGSALGEIGRQQGVSREETFAAGDHLNDLPMLSNEYARCLVAPNNAIDLVKATVREQGGYVSSRGCGHGIADGLEHYLSRK